MEDINVGDWVQSNPGLATISGLVLTGVAAKFHERIGFYIWYILIPSLFGLVVWLYSDESLYFYVFVLGMITALGEIISTFRDEPIKVLQTPHALAYHLLNGLIAAFALKVCLLYGVDHESALDRLKLVMVAGFGSMLIMRSKLFTVKVGNEDVAFGPEQIINVFLHYMQDAIDRVRAQSRIEFVKKRMDTIDCDKVKLYCVAMLASAQAMDQTKKQECIANITALTLQAGADDYQKQLLSYRLGFILLDAMGEDFVVKLFEEAKAEWRIRAPIPEKRETGILANLLGTQPVRIQYMAYGSSMSSRKFRERLKWMQMEETQFATTTNPRRCVLEKYRLEFNKPDNIEDPAIGYANIVPDQKDHVCGVLYDLTLDAVKFLDMTESGYRREKILVKTDDNKEIEAEVMVAETTKQHLSPTVEYLGLLIEGAEEHGLEPEYLDKLRVIRTNLMSVTTGAIAH